MNIPVVTTTASYHIKNAYKRYLYDYETHTREKDEKTVGGKTKKTKNSKSSSGNSSNIPVESSTKGEMTESDSEKDLKELALAEDSTHTTLRRTVAKRGRGRRKTRTDRGRSLKSPNSPTLSPLSDPCSPRSISSVSAAESAGCPSPSENHCDVRELRGKIDSVLGKDNDSCKIESDLSGKKSREFDGSTAKDGLNCKTKNKKKDECCAESDGEVVQHEDKIMNELLKSCVEAGDNLRKDNAESTCSDDNLLQVNEKQDCEKPDKEETLVKVSPKKESVEPKKDLKSIPDTESPLQKGGDNDLDDTSGDKSEHVDTCVDNQGQEGTDVEDAVDVVNSPSGTSETVDSDERSDRKPKSKKCGKNEAKPVVKSSHDDGDDVDGLEYKLNDRIDVRYGRGRNATIYQAKITCVDPCADEGLYYLVHYQGWNARHDEWIGDERIIGRGVKQTRTRSVKEPTKNQQKPIPKPTAKASPKPIAKKNGKNNGSGHVGRPPGSKRKRTPSPTMNTSTSSRNGNGRACKSRNTNEKTAAEPNNEVKCPSRITRRNSVTIPLETSDFLDQKSPDSKTESEKDSLPSPSRSQRNRESKSPSPKRTSEKTSEPTVAKDEKLEDVKVEGNIKVEKNEEVMEEASGESKPSEVETDAKTEVAKPLKRPREEETEGSSSTGSTPAKKKSEREDSPSEDVFEADASESPSKEANTSEHTETAPTHEEANGPDLTCSEQLPTHCASPDPYTTNFAEGGDFYGNGVERAEAGSKEKDSSSSVDDGKVEKPAPTRKTKCRRDRKSRAPSSQSSFDTSECHNGNANDPTVGVMLSPSWTPQYNFTEDLDELLKNEESSERIRLLTERIKDIRKVYGELKSEVANIDRKRKRRQKRKREEELSTEEGNTRSPSRSSPLATTTSTAVSSANSLAAVECR